MRVVTGALCDRTACDRTVVTGTAYDRMAPQHHKHHPATTPEPPHQRMISANGYHTAAITSRSCFLLRRRRPRTGVGHSGVECRAVRHDFRGWLSDIPELRPRRAVRSDICRLLAHFERSRCLLGCDDELGDVSDVPELNPPYTHPNTQKPHSQNKPLPSTHPKQPPKPKQTTPKHTSPAQQTQPHTPCQPQT